jgi:hypothetical protein
MSCPAEAQGNPLFFEKGQIQTAEDSELESWVAQQVSVAVDNNVLSTSASFELSLFGNDVVADQGAPMPLAAANSDLPVVQTSSGNLTKNGEKVGTFTISRVSSRDSGTATYGHFATLDGSVYTLKNSSEGQVFEALHAPGFPGCANHDHSEMTDIPHGTPRIRKAPVAALDIATVDILVAYTPGTAAELGGDAEAIALINTAVSLSNDAYAESNANVRLNLVKTHKLTTNSTGSFSTDIENARTDNDGMWDELHTLREENGADLVSVITTNTQYCGIGYLLNPNFPSATLGFNIISHVCATGYYSFAHEIGHNMGLAHDVANAGGSGAFDYSHGYHFNSNTFRTVMAYSPGTRIGRFSNPDVTYEGFFTGEASSADNARTLDETGSLVAAFVQSTGGGGDPGGGSGSETGGGGGEGGGSGATQPSELSLILSKVKRSWDVQASAISGSLDIGADLYCAQVNRKGKLKSGFELYASTTLSSTGYAIFPDVRAKRGYACLVSAESAEGTVQSEIKVLTKRRKKRRKR